MTRAISVLLTIVWLGWAAPVVAQEDPRETFRSEWALATQLVDARALPEAEALLIRMAEDAAAAFGPDAPETLRVRSQLAEVVLGQRRWTEAETLARPVYLRALELQGPDTETTDEARLVLVSAALRDGRLAEAAPLARASFDYLLATEGPDGGAADLAGLLATIYGRLGQPEEADAVLALVGGEGAFALVNQMERRRAAGDTAGVVQTTRALLLRGDLEAPVRIRAETDLASGLLELARAGDAAALIEAEGVARAAVRSRQGGDAGTLASAEGVLGEVLLFDFAADLPPARIAEGLAMQRSAHERMRAARGAGHALTIQDQLTYAMSLVAFERYGDGLAQLQDIEALAARGEAHLAPEQAAFVSLTEVGVRMGAGDPDGAYASLSEAARTFQIYALAPDRSGRAHNYLSDHAFVFRTQVAIAWTNAARMSD
ncbi:MAG: hypothetical protein V4707_01705 [Pseudomonadota bacterium]